MKRNSNNTNAFEQKLFMIGVNAAGLFNKTESLMRIVSLFKPGVVFVQETKARRKNKLNLANYVCFEMIREDVLMQLKAIQPAYDQILFLKWIHLKVASFSVD